MAKPPNVVSVQSLPALIDRAASALTAARSSAEVLDARNMAGFVYDTAKRAARIAKAKNAHDALIAAAHRAQADALEIDAGAKRRLADEYDAAQARGEVATAGKRSQAERLIEAPPSAADIGLSRKEIHEARIIRDAEVADPGIVRRTVDQALAAGHEPSKALVRRAVSRTRHAASAPLPQAQRGREAALTRVREALTALAGLPEPHEVAAYFKGSDAALVVAETIQPALNWLVAFSSAFNEATDA